MMKKFLSASLLAIAALSAQAYEVGDFAYSKVAKYQITGENLVVNGLFTDGATGFGSGWTATDATVNPLEATFTMVTGGPDGSNIQKVNAGMTGLDAGMYQNIAISQGGTYVVSFKVKSAVDGFTDIDMTGGNTNYMNSYYNTDGALATVDGTNLYFGTNGINGGYQFSFSDIGFTDAVFAVDAPAEGNIIIDFRGLQEGMEIADVECHLAEKVYDDRIAKNRIAYFKKFLTSEECEYWAFYEDLKVMMEEVGAALEANASIGDMELLMENLEMIWQVFVAENFDDALSFVAGTGNNSANWMNWTTKYNKLNSQYNGTAPWKWSTDRWCHKTAAVDSPMAIQWMRGAGANSKWNNIATLTTTLTPGTYYWGVSGQGGMMTLNKNRWVRSWADECAMTQLFFNGDTTDVFVLNAARTEDYVFEFKLDVEKEVALGIVCNNGSSSLNAGFDVQFYSPILYKVRDGGLSVEEINYLKAVALKLEELKEQLNVAIEYANNDEMPWGREALENGIADVRALYNEWSAMSELDILDWLYNEQSLSETIEMSGTLHLVNEVIEPFIAINVPLTEMPDAIEEAWTDYARRIYSSSSKMHALEEMILETENLYYEMLGTAYSEENAAAMIKQKAQLEAMVEEFKEAISATTLADIDFNNVSVAEHVDAEGMLETYWTIDGAVGTMKLASYANGALGTTMYELGYNGLDSLNMLRVGNGEAVVDLGNVDAEIVNIKFNLYAGRLSSKKIGYKILDNAGEIICGLFFSSYSGTDDLNTFGVDYNSYIPGVGSSSSRNAAIAAESNKTSFDIVLDYGIGKMYCTTSSSKGTVTTEEIDLAANAPRQFVLYSDYNNADRRCWFDNLVIKNIGESSQGGDEEEVHTSDVFTVQDTEVFKGSSFAFPVSMTNENSITAFQCDVYLSDGLVLNLNDEDEYDVILNADRKTSSHSATASLQPDSAIRVIAYSSSNKLFRGNSGELFTLNLTALEGYAEDQTIEIRNIRLSTADEHEYLAAPISAAVTVKSYTPADANGDGQITIVDVVAVVNALMGATTGNFVFDAADMDQNGQITIVDVVAVVNALMGVGDEEETPQETLDIQLETKDGQVIKNGSKVSITADMVDMMIWGQVESNIYVRNLTGNSQGVYAEVKALNGDNQVCWGGSCVPLAEGSSYTTGMGLVGANSSTSLLIESLVMESNYMSVPVTRTVEVTVWTDGKPDEKYTATVTYSYVPSYFDTDIRPVVSRFERSNIHVADTEVAAGETTTLYVQLDNAQAYTAMQMDVELPEGLSIEGVEMVGNASHAVAYSEEGRIAAYSLTNRAFNGGESLMAITVKADENFTGSANVGFTNVRVVSKDIVETTLGNASSTVIGGGANGIDGVEADKAQVVYYSTTGEVSDKPFQGLNIIKRIYQNGRVEVSKEMK